MVNNDEYYNLLNLNKNASSSDIKKAYRKMAIKWHPDKNQNNKKKAEETFKKISEAYQVLSDPEKKKIYDQFGKDGLENNGMNGFDPSNMPDIFSHIFGGNMGMNSRKNKTQNQEPAKTAIFVSMEDIFNQKEIDIEYERNNMCVNCDGTGFKDKKIYKCKKCNGSCRIKIQRRMGPMIQITETKCNECNGKGIDLKNINICNICNGSKFTKEKIKKKIKIPKGIYNGQHFIIKNEGHQYSVKENRSDLVVFVEEEDHQHFKRGVTINGQMDPSNILIELDISLAESICGFSKNIKHFNNDDININVDEIIKDGDIKVIINKGMPKFQKNGYGDLFIKFKVIYPDNNSITQEKKNKIWKILTDTDFKIKDNNNSSILHDIKNYNSGKNYYDDDNHEQNSQNIQCAQQ